MWKHRAIWIAGISGACAAFLFFQMGMYAVHKLFGIDLKLNLFDLCEVLFGVLGISYIMAVMQVLIWSTLAAALLLATTTLFITCLAYRRISSMIQECDGKGLSLPKACLVVAHSAPAAFTIGFFKPKIVLTTGLVELLNDSELQAVLSHEQHHQRYRDPLVICLLTIIAKAMWYIPLFKWVSENYKVAVEILADKRAIQKLGSPVDLGEALLKMLRYGQDAGVKLPASSYVSFAQSSINLRILHILNPQMTPAFNPPLLRCIVSVLCFCAVALLI